MKKSLSHKSKFFLYTFIFIGFFTIIYIVILFTLNKFNIDIKITSITSIILLLIISIYSLISKHKDHNKIINHCKISPSDNICKGITEKIL